MPRPALCAAALPAIALLLALSAAPAAATCLYSADECHCIERPATMLCLRFIRVALNGVDECEAFPCGGGFMCDCSGTKVCRRSPCKLSGDFSYSYDVREKGVKPTAAGQRVPCVRVERIDYKCAAPPSATPTVSPTPSNTPDPTDCDALCLIYPPGDCFWVYPQCPHH